MQIRYREIISHRYKREGGGGARKKFTLNNNIKLIINNF